VRRVGILLVLVLSVGASALMGQESSDSAAASSSPASPAPAAPSSAAAPAAMPLPASSSTPEYKPENPWRRFEIVSLGAFPISLFYVGFASDIGSYVGSNFDYRYAPWPFQSAASILPTDSQRLIRLGTAAALSLVIGGIDAIIHAHKMRAKEQKPPAESIQLDSAGAGD